MWPVLLPRPEWVFPLQSIQPSCGQDHCDPIQQKSRTFWNKETNCQDHNGGKNSHQEVLVLTRFSFPVFALQRGRTPVAISPRGIIIIMAGIYYGAMYGGSTTAILINFPGEVAARQQLTPGSCQCPREITCLCFRTHRLNCRAERIHCPIDLTGGCCRWWDETQYAATAPDAED